MYGEAKIYLAKVIEVQGSKVKVEYTHTKSDFVPYLQTSNTFKTHFTPPQINEVVIFFKFERSGFVIGSILPPHITHTQENQESITYADGTIITYKDGILEIDSLKELIIKCKNAKIEADSITLGENVSALSGVVTGECVCPFTGSPHADFSQKVKVAK
ncbi:hypothetical protein LS68_008065 [Helicobacter sp. MIT 05-5293]|uniref:hypothetical protein n=1 Tax=Helicobacter sp. MIT 05-5293 TaxID=1548149 RepID=UPI00051D8908|nr:hypothetical protein [Helicobacter sp. MIT 05-5293]TLD80163.1 hypothetical protein LS68_008065 [Helicobacter sp. MIT 05-5293]